jgi:predicted ATPase/DNA-binding SARP family transcriptional activator
VLKLELFGKFRIRDCQGRDLHISTKKTQWLLAYLLLHPSTHTREHIAGLFWPESSDAKASNSLRQALHSLTKSLELGGPSRGHALTIATQLVEFKLSEDMSLDTLDFSRALRQCNEKSELDNESCLKAAIAFYKGDLLEGCDERWCIEQRDYFKDLYLRALGQLIHIYLERKEYAKAIELAREVLNKTPWHEPVHRQLMYIYSAMGDRNAAIQQYRECRRVLRKELGVDPLPETETLYRQIEERSRNVQIEQFAALGRGIMRLYPELGAPFIGRLEECQRLLRAWNAALNNKGSAIFLEGEAGIGKSRLVQEFLGIINKQKFFCFTGRCFDIERNLPYECLIEALRPTNWTQLKRYVEEIKPLWLAQVAKLLPELTEIFDELLKVAPLSSLDSEQNRLLEGLTQFFLALAMHRPLLIVLDDLQWSDPVTLQFVQYFLRRVKDKPIFFLGTYRVEEVNADHGLHKLMQPLERENQAIRLRLRSMQVSEVEQLVRDMLKTQALRTLEEWIFAQSKGVPLVAVELIKSFLESGILRLAENGNWVFDAEKASFETIPSTIQSVIESRLRRLSKGSRQLIDLASVLGRDLRMALLKSIMRREHDAILEELEELMQTRLIIYEQNEYHFRHDVIRDFIYRLVIPERRFEFHQAVAKHLVESNAENVNAIAGELAYHFTEAGNLEQALVYSLKAGEAARKVYSNASAIQFLTKAIELAERLKQEDALRESLTQLCTVCVYSGKPAEGIEYGWKALELTKDVHARARLWETMAEGYNYLVEHTNALECCEVAIKELGKKDKSLELVLVLNCYSLVLSQVKNYRKCNEICKQALKIAKSLNQPNLTARIFTNLSRSIYFENKKKSFEYDQHALQYAIKSQDQSTLVEAYYAMGNFYFFENIPIKALDCFKRALECAQKIGDIVSLIWLHELLSWSEIQLGRLDEAETSARNALDLAMQSQNKKGQAAANAILGCITSARRDSLAEKKYFDLTAKSIEANEFPYTTVIFTFSLLGQTEKAIQWLNKCSSSLPTEKWNYLLSHPLLQRFRESSNFKEIYKKKVRG